MPTAGLQLISTGHSLVDAYMAFDVDEFAQLYQLTGDAHYLDVARLLLHNTKNMLALPGRTYDLGEPGWQQEHWSLAPAPRLRAAPRLAAVGRHQPAQRHLRPDGSRPGTVR